MVGCNFLEHPALTREDVFAPSSQELNLLDYQSAEAYLASCKPDVIVHAAGRVGGIQKNIKEPVRFLTDNLDMGRNIVLAARKVGVTQLLNLGSSCMYPRNAPNPLKESMILAGELEPTNEGYALAKIVTARLCEYISREDSEFAYKTLVPCNIYGAFDKFDPESSHLIPAIIHKLYQAKKSGEKTIEIWGDGTARREFMYAADLADCMVEALGQFDSLPEVMNVGIGKDYSINEYYEIAAEVIGFQGDFKHDLDRPVGMKQKLVSTEKLDAWSWHAKTELREGIAKTYEYYLEKKDSFE